MDERPGTTGRRFPGPAGVIRRGFGPALMSTQSQFSQEEKSWMMELTHLNPVWQHLQTIGDTFSLTYNIAWAKERHYQNSQSESMQSFFKIPHLVGAIKTIDDTASFNPT